MPIDHWLCDWYNVDLLVTVISQSAIIFITYLLCKTSCVGEYKEIRLNSENEATDYPFLIVHFALMT